MSASSPVEQSRESRAWLAAVLIALMTFAAVAPTLRWPQFTGGNENIVVATALEMRAGGPWLVPQLNGEPRVKKPPLVAWITALTLQQPTIHQLDSSNPAVRRAAYYDLGWQVRWTGLLAGCVTILATFVIGRTIADSATGLAAAMIVAANLLFMKYMRQSTSDVHLAMWVTIANACFALGIVQRRWWLAATFGSLATGMAFLCKGPVALLETVLPLVVGMLVFRKRATDVDPAGVGFGARKGVLLSTVGIVVFALVALPWFIYVLQTVPNVWNTWFTEVTREGATDLEASSPFKYFQLFVMLWPWLVFGVIGWVVIARDWRSPKLLAVLQVILPLLVMVWFRDRKERYLLPMVGPSAVICALGLVAWVRDWQRRDPARSGREKTVLAVHLMMTLGGAVALAWVGVGMKTIDGQPWWSVRVAAGMSGLFLAIGTVALMLQQRRPWAIAGGTFALMLLLQAVFMQGYARGDSGMSMYAPLAETIRKVAPDAVVYDFAGKDRRVNEELAIYLNRAIHPARPEDVRPASGRPGVILIRQDRGEPAPILDAPWQLIGNATEKRQTWWAFLLPPA